VAVAVAAHLLWAVTETVRVALLVMVALALLLQSLVHQLLMQVAVEAVRIRPVRLAQVDLVAAAMVQQAELHQMVRLTPEVAVAVERQVGAMAVLAVLASSFLNTLLYQHQYLFLNLLPNGWPRLALSAWITWLSPEAAVVETVAAVPVGFEREPR